MIKLAASILLCLLIYSKSYSQIHYPVIAMELQSVPVANNVTNGQPDISDSTTFRIVMKIAISDTVSIGTLNVSLRKDETDNTIIFSKTFTYDVSGTFSDGTSYSRSGYEITLLLGTFMGTIRPYAELVVSNNTGIITDPIVYY